MACYLNLQCLPHLSNTVSGTPQSSYNGIETISWDFTTNVDAMFAADTLFQTLIDNLTNAANDAYAARRINGSATLFNSYALSS